MPFHRLRFLLSPRLAVTPLRARLGGCRRFGFILRFGGRFWSGLVRGFGLFCLRLYRLFFRLRCSWLIFRTIVNGLSRVWRL